MSVQEFTECHNKAVDKLSKLSILSPVNRSSVPRPDRRGSSMAKSFRVSHITRNYSLNFDQVEKAIRQHCSFVWVEKGKTFRDATFAEAAAFRKKQEPEVEPIPFAEIPGLKYEPSVQNQASTRLSYAILKQANQFCAQHG